MARKQLFPEESLTQYENDTRRGSSTREVVSVDTENVSFARWGSSPEGPAPTRRRRHDRKLPPSRGRRTRREQEVFRQGPGGERQGEAPVTERTIRAVGRGPGRGRRGPAYVARVPPRTKVRGSYWRSPYWATVASYWKRCRTATRRRLRSKAAARAGAAAEGWTTGRSATRSAGCYPGRRTRWTRCSTGWTLRGRARRRRTAAGGPSPARAPRARRRRAGRTGGACRHAGAAGRGAGTRGGPSRPGRCSATGPGEPPAACGRWSTTPGLSGCTSSTHARARRDPRPPRPRSSPVWGSKGLRAPRPARALTVQSPFVYAWGIVSRANCRHSSLDVYAKRA